MNTEEIIKGLSPAMRRALLNAADDGNVMEARRDTGLALVARGLAEAVWGNVERRNRYSRLAQTVYDAYLGARLTETGRQIAATLKSQERGA